MELAGVITGAIGALVAVVSLGVLALRGVFSLERRISRLETQMEPFWDAVRLHTANILSNIKPPGNPVTEERWQFLLGKLRQNVLTVQEARELERALLDQQEEARKKNDLAVLIAVGLGLALLAALLSGKK